MSRSSPEPAAVIIEIPGLEAFALRVRSLVLNGLI
jgi:hypothetical protein